MFFFFKQKTAYEMRISDWSSDVCSSDLNRTRRGPGPEGGSRARRVDRSGGRLEQRPGPESRYGCFLPDLTGLASDPSAANLPTPISGIGPAGASPRQAPGGRVFHRHLPADFRAFRRLLPASHYCRSRVMREPSRAGKATRAMAQSRSEEHTSELQSLMRISYAAF